MLVNLQRHSLLSEEEEEVLAEKGTPESARLWKLYRNKFKCLLEETNYLGSHYFPNVSMM